MRKRVLKSFLLSLIMTLSFGLTFVSTGLAQSPNYSVFERPGPKNKPTPIHIGIVIINIDEIDGATQTITANLGVNMMWKDLRLAGDGNVDKSFQLAEIWNPRIQILNQRKLIKTLPEVVHVDGEGFVTYRQRYWGQFSYPFNLKNFPLDKDKFGFILVSTGHSPDEIQFINNEGITGLGPKSTQAEWKIHAWSVEPMSYELSIGKTSLPGFVFWIHASRRIGYYIIKIILPLFMIIFMSYLIFWIDHKNFGQKISIAVTAMLTLIAYRFIIGNFLPRISYLTRMDYFLLGASVLIFGALVQCVWTYRLSIGNKAQLAKKVDYWSRILFPSALVVLILFSFII